MNVDFSSRIIICLSQVALRYVLAAKYHETEQLAKISSRILPNPQLGGFQSAAIKLEPFGFIYLADSFVTYFP